MESEDLRLITGDTLASEYVGALRTYWNELKQFCAANDLPFDPYDEKKTNEMWVIAGFQAFMRSPEMARKPGRPPGSAYRLDLEMALLIEAEASCSEIDPELLISKFVQEAVQDGRLPTAERTTHTKRLRRLIRRRKQGGFF